MGVHQSEKNPRPDDEFIPGEIELLVEGNRCRALDGRRTPGVIERYFPDSAMFRWRIIKYEDEGNYWDLPAERVCQMQFEPDAARLPAQLVSDVKEKIEFFQKPLVIKAEESQRLATEGHVQEITKQAQGCLQEESTFFQDPNPSLDFSSRQGSKALADDLKRYMSAMGLSLQEASTAEGMVLNPYAGEWNKGMEIAFAELGLTSYQGTIPRTADIFKGPGRRTERKRYIIHRLAFVRAFMALLDIAEVVVYRGMASERDWAERARTLLSCTFSLEVAKAFCHFERDDKYRISYLVKLKVPVDKLFMTHWETTAMNQQYHEAEVLVIHDTPLVL